VIFQNPGTFAGRIRELIAYLESENRDQAELSIDDGIEFLQRSLSAQADRSKTGSLSARAPVVLGRSFGIDRVRETFFAYDQARMSIASGDLRAALVASRKALDAWEQKPTEPKEDAPNAEDFDLGDQGQSGG